MSKLKSLVTTALIGSLVLSTISPTFASTPITQERLSGLDRYKTANAIAQKGWVTSMYGIVACGENYPDALAASTLAKRIDAPIFLTTKNSISQETMDIMKSLGIVDVTIVGGTGVVSTKVEEQLRANSIFSSRKAGNNRYETSVKIAEGVPDATGVILTTGDDYADALSIGSIAGMKNMVILLVPKDYLPEATKNYLKTRKFSKTYVVGDASIISDTVANQFPNVQRITGKDKYERNLNIIKTFESELDKTGVCVATGENFADALTGTAYAATKSQPILLLPNGVNGDISEYLSSKSSNLKKITVFGGDAVVPTSTLVAYLPTITGGSSTSSPVISDPGNASNPNYGTPQFGNTEGALWYTGKKLGKPVFDPSMGDYYYSVETIAKAMGATIESSSPTEIKFTVNGHSFTLSSEGKCYQDGEELWVNANSLNGGIYIDGSICTLVFGNFIYDKEAELVYGPNLADLETDIHERYATLRKMYDHIDPKTYIPTYGTGFKSNEIATVKPVVDGITQGMSTEIDKVKAIRDWVSANIYYDYDSYEGTGEFFTPEENFKGRSYAYKAFDNKTGVCGEYAILSAAMLRVAGIPSRVVVSDIHTWTEAYADGKWVQFDATAASRNEYRAGQFITKPIATMTISDSTDTYRPSYDAYKYFLDLSVGWK